MFTQHSSLRAFLYLILILIFSLHFTVEISNFRTVIRKVTLSFGVSFINNNVSAVGEWL